MLRAIGVATELIAPLFVVHVLAEVGYSGGEFQLERLIEHLQARGHQNHVVIPPNARFAEVCERLDVPITELPLRRPWQSFVVLQLRSLIRRLGPDVVHFGCGRSTLWGGIALMMTDGPLKICTRRIDYPIAKTPFGAGRYRRLVDHVVANCGAVRLRLLDAGVPADRISLIYEGIETESLASVERDREAARRALDLDQDALVVSCAATLRPRKGQRILIEAFEDIAARFPNAVLVLAGEGDDRRCLLQKVKSSGLTGRVRLPGAVHPARNLHAASDIAVMASFHEGLSNACLEASAAGLPLVVSDVGGLPEIVEDGRTGYVVPPGDVSAFADRIGRLLEDVALRRAVGVAGRARTAANFQIGSMAQSMEMLLLDLLARRRLSAGLTEGAVGAEEHAVATSRNERSSDPQPAAERESAELATRASVRD